MKLNRRMFLSTAALGAAGFNLPARAAGSKPNLRVGILSDVHVTAVSNAEWFEKALRYFDSIKVDGVLITGDLTTWNKKKEFEAVAATWYKVFPGDRRSDGEHVEKLFLTGNHDVDGWAYDGARFKNREEAEPESFFFHREAFWKELFHEDYKPIVVKELKGYTFILRNWMSLLESEHQGMAKGFKNEQTPIVDVLAQLGDAKLRAGKPFFYAQHEQLDDTVNATWLIRGAKWDNGQIPSVTRDCLSKYPNCIAFSGHSHNSLTDERSIWQGAFTAVNCSCARGYAFTPPGRENGFACPDFNRTPPFEMDKFDHQSVRQGMVMEVFDDRITFAKREFTYDQVLADDWVVPLYAGGAAVPPTGTPKYDFKTRAAAAKAPVFAKGAKVSVAYVKEGYRRTVAGMGGLDGKNPHPQLKVAFPPVTRKGSPSRAFEFRVVCEAQDADMVRVVEERRVFSPNAYQAETRDVAPCSCNFPVSNLQTSGVIRFVVFPIDCWGNEGAPVKSAWKNLKAWCADGGR